MLLPSNFKFNNKDGERESDNTYNIWSNECADRCFIDPNDALYYQIKPNNITCLYPNGGDFKIFTSFTQDEATLYT